MKGSIAELVFVLDRSGSMSGLESETIDGFNRMIERQKKAGGKCYVTTVLFDTETYCVHDRVELAEIRPMTDRDYMPGGCTALLDAMGSTIDRVAVFHRLAHPEEVPEYTILVVMTDGLENASRCYSRERVKHLVEQERDWHGWEFLFLAANIDAAETAGQIGIRADWAADYTADAKGIETAFDSLADTVCAQRMGIPIKADWKRKIEEDRELRSRRG